jgi:hypothetical protein
MRNQLQKVFKKKQICIPNREEIERARPQKMIL